MPAEPLDPIPDPITRDDVLLLQWLATKAQPPDQNALDWCKRALDGDVEALSYLRSQLVAAQEAIVEDRREEIRVENTVPGARRDCPECGGTMVYETRPDTIEYAGQSRPFDMLAFWCADCGKAIFQGQPLADREKALLELQAEAHATRPDDIRVIIARDVAEYRTDADPTRWWLRRRELPDGRVLHLHRMPHFYRLSVGPRDLAVFDSVYDFEADETAWRAILEWDGTGDPEGWFRHPGVDQDT